MIRLHSYQVQKRLVQFSAGFILILLAPILTSMNDQANQPVSNPSIVRYFVLSAFCILALIAYVQRNSIGVAEADIRQELGLSKYQMGWVISSFFLTYAAFQLPTGYLGQLFGTRKALTVYSVCFSVLAGCFALVFNPWLLLATRCGMGATQAGIFPCAVNSIAKWLPDSRRSFSTGMLGSFMSIGGAVGVALTGLLLPWIGWRIAYLIYCVPGLIFAVWFYWWFRDCPDEHPSVSPAELKLISASTGSKKDEPPKDDQPSDVDNQSSWLSVLAHRSIIALCGQQAFRAAGQMFFASWFATYLRETRGVDVSVAGLLTSLPIVAIVFGSPTGGLLSDWILQRTGNRNLSRRGIGAMAMLTCAMLVMVSFQFSNPWIAVLLISVGSFFAAFAGPCAYTSTIDLGGKHVPVVFGTMNMAGNFGAFLFPIVVPWLLNESELYVDKLKLVAESKTELTLDAEEFEQANASTVDKFGEDEDAVVRFHHGKTEETVLFSQYNVNVESESQWKIAIRHAGRNSPPLRLLVNGKEVTPNALGDSSNDELQWTDAAEVTLPEGLNKLRIESKTTASGNWNLVLYMFAGIYLAACFCWVFVDTKTTLVQ